MSEWHNSAAWREARARARKVLEPICVQCHKELAGEDFTIDHIVPPSRTGGIPNNNLENLQALCRSCNGRKQDKVITRVTQLNPRWHT